MAVPAEAGPDGNFYGQVKEGLHSHLLATCSTAATSVQLSCTAVPQGDRSHSEYAFVSTKGLLSGLYRESYCNMHETTLISV